jgi:hypothetical protein
MTTRLLPGHRTWSLRREPNWHRTYQVVHRVACDPGDGPYAVLATFGLPRPGDHFAIGNDVDLWAWCHADADIKPVLTEGEVDLYYDVEQTFSTHPPERPGGGNDPLLQPPKISGSFTRTSEEATTDRFGRLITTSSWEQIRGPQVQFDSGNLTVSIEQNLAMIDLVALAAAYEAVNAVPMWGMPPRTIKLTNAHWTENPYTVPENYPLFGLPARSSVYYTRTVEFEVNALGWDRNILDEGTKVLHGRWKSAVSTTTTTTVAGTTTTTTTTTAAGTTTTTPPIIVPPVPVLWELLPVDADGNMPDPNNPNHFDRFQDRNGNVGKVILNGRGVPAGSVVPLGSLFLCISNAPDNTNKPLTNTSVWIPVVSSQVSAPLTWVNTETYRRGDLVTDTSGGIYVTLKTWVGLTGEEIVGPSAKPDVWLHLPIAPVDRSFYNPTTNYVLADYVEISTATAAGIIHVERAAEFDFVGGLGVPAVLLQAPVVWFDLHPVTGLMAQPQGGGSKDESDSSTTQNPGLASRQPRPPTGGPDAP